LRAITVHPPNPNSIELRDVPEPAPEHGTLLVEAIALGVCGTDREIIAGEYGEAPADNERLILGQESLGRVRDAPDDCGLKRGDHVVGIVRQPDPIPCVACASGQWDMCRNGQYTEHGIKGLNGFGAERWRIDPAFAVKVDSALGLNAVLMEPASVGRESVGSRASPVAPRRSAAAARPHYRRRPDRPARRTARPAARPRRACLRSQQERTEAGDHRGARRDLSQRCD
jgi:threonine dehydrogenase-like Zn-dependent dehydrogenase